MASVARGKFRFSTTPCGHNMAWACHLSAPTHPPSPSLTLLRLPDGPLMRQAHSHPRAFALAVSSAWNALPLISLGWHPHVLQDFTQQSPSHCHLPHLKCYFPPHQLFSALFFPLNTITATCPPFYFLAWYCPSLSPECHLREGMDFCLFNSLLCLILYVIQICSIKSYLMNC